MSLARGAFKKELWSKRQSNQRPLLTTVMDEREQAQHVTETILGLRERGIALRDQAVLIRASQHSLTLEVELARTKIPFLKWWQNPRDQIAGWSARRGQ
jgi:DNA helicase-2/ATP-dependent DNA helicase PcrA